MPPATTGAGRAAALVQVARRLVAVTFGSASPLVLARLLSAVLTFGLPLALVRLLDPDAYGAYKQFFLLVTTLLLVGQCGLTQSLFYFLPRGAPDRQDARGSYVGQAIGLVWMLALISGVGLWLAAPRVLGWFGASALAVHRTPLALTTALMMAATPLESALTANARIRAAALVYVLGDGVRAAALVAAARWRGPSGLFWAAAAVAALRVLAMLGAFARRLLPLARPTRARLVEQLRYALPYAGASLFFVCQRYCAQYLVSARVDAATFPVFSIAAFHLPVIDIVFTPTSEVLMVALGRTLGRDHAASRAAFHDATNRLAAVLFPAAAGAWLVGSTVLPLLFTHTYAAAVPLFHVATLLIPFCILPVDALLRAAGDTRFLLRFNAARVPFTVALVLIGLHVGDLAGAMLATVAAEALARVGMLVRARRYLGDPRLGELLDWRFLRHTTLASAIACVPALGVRLLDRAPLTTVIGTVAVYGVAYLVARSLPMARRSRRLILSLAERAAPSEAPEV